MDTDRRRPKCRSQVLSNSGARLLRSLRAAPKPIAPFETAVPPVSGEAGLFQKKPETVVSLERALERLRELETIVNRSPVVAFKRGILPGSPLEFITENVRQFGYRADEFLSGEVSLPAIIHHEDAARIKAETETYLKQESPTFSLEYRLLTRSGNERWVEERNYCVRDDEGRAIAIEGVLFDITERKQLREEILAVSAREQARISRDLHDIVGQSLTGIAILTKSLANGLEARQSPAAEDAAHLTRLINEAVAKTRQLSRGILPFEPTSSGLVEAIENYASGTRYLFGLNCRFQADAKTLAIDDTVAVHLYRIVQEAVNNAVKHAKASDILITLAANCLRATLSVRDNGIGLPPGWDDGDGLGVRIMRYRAERVGADFDVRNAPGGGTIVVCTLNEL